MEASLYRNIKKEFYLAFMDRIPYIKLKGALKFKIFIYQMPPKQVLPFRLKPYYQSISQPLLGREWDPQKSYLCHYQDDNSYFLVLRATIFCWCLKNNS
jgi:hypothetical protein